MNKKLALLFWCLAVINTYPQVGMMTNNPNPDSVLDLNNSSGTNTKGLLLPQIKLTATDSPLPMSAHVPGMKVYNTATDGAGGKQVIPGVYYNDGYKWIAEKTSASAWTLPGNTGTNPSVNSVGTLDNTDFVIRTNRTEQMRINAAGQLLIGTPAVLTGGSATKVMVNNNTTAGALQLRDGTQAAGKVLTSDANGLATWKTRIAEILDEPTFGAAGTGGAVMPVNSAYSAYIYTGSSVTLPPGKWLLTITAVAGRTDGAYTGFDDSWDIYATFSDGPTILTGSSDRQDIAWIRGVFPSSSKNCIVSGNLILNNTTGTNKTYYHIAWGNSFFSNGPGTITYPIAGSYENRLIAERIN